MEFIVGLIVVGVIAYFAFFRKKAETVEAAPYKVDAPAPAVESAPVVEEAPAKKPRAKKAPAAKKPAVKKATTRKPKAK